MMQAIYVFRAPGRTKVGISNSPSIRLGQLRERLSGLEFFYAASTNGFNAAILERRAHDILSDHRIKGEIFSVDGRVAVAAIMQAAAELGVTLRERGVKDNEDATVFTFRGRPKLRAALERMAREDVRTLSSMIEKILTQAARGSGHYQEGEEEDDHDPVS